MLLALSFTVRRKGKSPSGTRRHPAAATGKDIDTSEPRLEGDSVLERGIVTESTQAHVGRPGTWVERGAGRPSQAG